MPKRFLLLLAPAVALGACTPVDHGFGETTRWNIEQQVVDPDPQYAGNVMEGGSGKRGADAVDRYNRGEVRRPAPTGTSGSSSGSSSTSGGPQ